ncbi:MAG TPA: hypothetical protein VLW17_10560 [Thermoanaerobaculaceae bacterium]|nr:hypothetical protein [Thermoanaerobaculaceae bacterium]
MPGRSTPPRQLDIPLVWERGEPPAAPSGPAPRRDDPAAAGARVGLVRLWVASLADLGLLLLAVGSAWTIAAVGGIAWSQAQLALAALAGLEAVSVLDVACVWIWRGSPGMLLLRTCFAEPMPLRRAFRLWAVWLVSLVAVGVPLLVRRRGSCVAERLAGAPLSFRPLPGSA